MQIFIIVGAINFFIFFVNAVTHGGDAVNGKFEDGHYYLGSHGKLTEVSKDEFEKSKFHTYSVVISWPFVMLAAFIYNKRRPKRLL